MLKVSASFPFLSTAAEGQRSDFSTQGWFIGTMCAVALLTLVVLMACFVRRNKGGKYAGTPSPRPQQQDMFSMGKGQLVFDQGWVPLPLRFRKGIKIQPMKWAAHVENTSLTLLSSEIKGTVHTIIRNTHIFSSCNASYPFWLFWFESAIQTSSLKLNWTRCQQYLFPDIIT